MAKKKKSQVPPPPRTVQAPKVRSSGPRKPASGGSTRDPRRTKMLVAAGVGALLLAGGIVGAAVALSGGGSDTEAGAADAAAAGCTREDFPAMGRQHVTELQPDFEYNSRPATSGPHYPETAVWNAYGEPVDELRLVHNLEHGGIVVQYGSDVPDATVEEILAWYRPDPNGVVVAPRDDLGGEVALTAWGHLMTCTQGFDEAVFSAFRDDFRFKGPEAFPPEALAPGQL